MATSYEKLYENVLPKFQSYEIPVMTEEEVKELLHTYLIPAISKFHVCRKNLHDRDDEQEVFNADLSDIEIEILSNYLLLEYIDSNYIRVPRILKGSLSSTDFNAFSPANLLGKMIEMHNQYLSENEGLVSKYSWFLLDNENYSNNSMEKLKNNVAKKKT